MALTIKIGMELSIIKQIKALEIILYHSEEKRPWISSTHDRYVI